MASVSGTNSSYSSLSSQIRGYGGLASGLDRDSLIEQMTAAMRSKIAKQGQQKTKLEWQRDALRDITSKIYNYTSDYTSYSSSKNLLSSNLFSRNQITAVGENSKYVSVSGTASSSVNMSIAAIKQLATNARLTTTGSISNGILNTGEMKLGSGGDLSATEGVSTIAGDVLYIKYGTTNYSVNLKDTDVYDYSTPEKAVESIKKALQEVEVGSGTNAQTLGDIIDVDMVGGKVRFKLDETKAHGNTVQLNGGTGNILQDLGFLEPGEKFSNLTDKEKTITANGLIAPDDAELIVEKTLAQRLSKSQINFSYNGQSKQITLGNYNDWASIEDVQKDLQNKLDQSFGKGRIKVELDKAADDSSASFSFKTTKPNGDDDTTSVLSIKGGTGTIIGNSGAFGIVAGTSNRLNQSATIANAGFKNADKFKELLKSDDTYYLNINGKEVKGITKDSTVKEIIDKINATEGIGVNVSYQEMSDRFVITSTEDGESGNIEIEDVPDNLAIYLFGKGSNDYTNVTDDTDIPGTQYEEGKDAILAVKYSGSEEEVEITRGSNVISMDGLNVTLKGTFGYKDGVIDKDTEAITFNAEVDADKAVEAVKEMVDAFNEILELVNTHVKTKPDRDYSPLTDEQKAELNEDQIERWEEKAKEGILFADMDLRMMSDNLRSIINSGNSTVLSSMGISTSTTYSDNGKLVFDEAKFRTALQADPEGVKEAFSKAVSKDENGNTIQGGLMVRIKSVMDKYGTMTGATKGILVERAGSIYAPTSVLSNSLQKQMDKIDDYIERLQDKLETETDRYISQFTSLETLISQMNNQSSYLSSMFA